MSEWRKRLQEASEYGRDQAALVRIEITPYGFQITAQREGRSVSVMVTYMEFDRAKLNLLVAGIDKACLAIT